MLYVKKSIYFLLLCLLTACANSEIEVAPWNNAPVPVVFSVISPNAPVQVYLNRTYNQSSPVVKNPYPEAKVYICGPDNNWVELTRLSPDTTIFKDTIKQLVIEKGKTYSLKVVLANSTVHAQTTIPSTPGVINEVTCQMLESYIDSNSAIYVNGELVEANVNKIDVSITPGSNAESSYFLSLFSDLTNDYTNISENRYQSSDFWTPKEDSTSFTLNLITCDRYYKRYLYAQSISEVSDDYSVNSPVMALIMSFGGVLPQFSNIVNGVGLFSNTVTDSKRVTVKPTAN
ncbi:MAG: hypothetical protein PHR83_11010 [Paludibacter sp.]|nr:hypothetical protein [Paludibacter sp.]